jgi:hypothetical protein
VKKGYEQTYDWVVNLLQDCDFEKSSKRMNLQKIDNNKVLVNFLGRSYAICKSGVDLVGTKINWNPKTEGYDYNLKSVLGYYVLSEADIEPIGDYCQFSYFSHGVFGDGHFDDEISKIYGKDYKKFCSVAEKLGMTFECEKSSGQYVWNYILLPKIPIKIIYYEGDDEFPTKLQILYDKTAIKVYKFEPLGFLHVSFIEGLVSIGECHND